MKHLIEFKTDLSNVTRQLGASRKTMKDLRTKSGQTGCEDTKT